MLVKLTETILNTNKYHILEHKILMQNKITQKWDRCVLVLYYLLSVAKAFQDGDDTTQTIVIIGKYK